MIKQLTTELKFLLTDSKEWSLSRFQLFFTTMLSNLIVWPAWWIICMKKGEIVDIPSGVGMAMGIACGVSGAIYGYGRREERLQRQSYQPPVAQPKQDEGEAD